MALTERERLYLENALEQIALAEAAARALQYSYQRRPEIEDSQTYDEAAWERWDALTARFARLADILTQRVFRAIDIAEYAPPEATYVDRLNRAEKRGHIGSSYTWREIREVRNQIVHEYASEHLLPLLQDVVRHTPELLACVQQVKEYARSIHARLQESIRKNLATNCHEENNS